jgi:hypothetical protein
MLELGHTTVGGWLRSESKASLIGGAIEPVLYCDIPSSSVASAICGLLSSKGICMTACWSYHLGLLPSILARNLSSSAGNNRI